MGLVGVAVLVKPDFQRLAEPCQRTVKRIGAGLFKERAAKAAVAGRFLAAVPPLDEDVVDLCQCVFQAAFALAQPLFGVVEGAFGKDVPRFEVQQRSRFRQAQERSGRLCASSSRNR